MVYHHLKEHLTSPLENILNKSMATGRVPDLMTLAKIIPIYKSKNKDSLDNHRPISCCLHFLKY